jgi:hypothetical protein
MLTGSCLGGGGSGTFGASFLRFLAEGCSIYSSRQDEDDAERIDEIGRLPDVVRWTEAAMTSSRDAGGREWMARWRWRSKW